VLSLHKSFVVLAGLFLISGISQAAVTLNSAHFDQVRVFPNPWRADQHSPVVTVGNLTVNTQIKIFTVSGRFVKALPMSSTSTTWDLTNDSGEKVASGVYLVLMETDAGDKHTSKLVVIR
jgi:hypothetical protein